MSGLAPPWQLRTKDASPESPLRATRTGQACHDIFSQFRLAVRCRACRVFTDLGPDALCWIQFWSCNRKPFDHQPRMLRQKNFDRFALMNRMSIPEQQDWAGHMCQQVFQKLNNLLPGNRVPMRLCIQFELAPTRSQAQSANQIQTVVMFSTRPNGRGFTTGCPSPLQGRDQGKPFFIEKNECCVMLTPLFLSDTKLSAASGQWLPCRRQKIGAGVSGNSTRLAAGVARRNSICSARQITSRSGAQCGQASSNPRHIPVLMPPQAKSLLTVPPARRIGGPDVQEGVEQTAVERPVLVAATGAHCVRSPQLSGRHTGVSCPGVTGAALACAVSPVVAMCRKVSYCTLSRSRVLFGH